MSNVIAETAAGIQMRLTMARADFRLSVDVDLPGRGVTALFGPSGSGKTTCLRCIAGLERGSRGSLRVNGAVWQDDDKALFTPPHRRAIGYVFQEPSLFPHLTVRGNLDFGFRRVGKAARRAHFEQAIDLLGIEPLLARAPVRLSGGERQRVAIARALLCSPRLLLMDEPLAALDLHRKREILPYLQRLHDELEIPVLYVSHASDEVARLADHLVLMEQGNVLASGPIASLLARLDLPTALDEDAGVVIEGRVLGYDADYQLLSLEFPDSQQIARIAHVPVVAGERLRFKIRARDVSVSLQRPSDTSVLNLLAVTVVDHAPADHPAHVMVRLDMDGTPLLARITRFSHHQLALRRGQRVWAQIKAVALLS